MVQLVLDIQWLTGAEARADDVGLDLATIRHLIDVCVRGR
jgi:hypothetical protein